MVKGKFFLRQTLMEKDTSENPMSQQNAATEVGGTTIPHSGVAQHLCDIWEKLH